MQINIIRLIAGASLGLLMAGLAAYNVNNWLAEGFVILAVIALCSEIIGFVMAVMVEMAVRERRPLAAFGCAAILLVCAGFNVIGAERAWDADMERHLASAQHQAQRDLDRTRGEWLQTKADAERQIAAYAHLLPGSDTMRARQAGMQAAWETATASGRDQALRAQRALDRLPVIAAPVARPFQTWQVQAGFGVAEFIKACGLWFCGFGAIALAGVAVKREEPGETNVIDLRERVRRLRAQKVSYGEIEKQTGVRKGTAWKWVNA